MIKLSRYLFRIMIVSKNLKLETSVQIVLNIMSNKIIKNVTMISADEILYSIVELAKRNNTN